MKQEDHLAVRLRRLTFRANHRGFKEADLILGNFVTAHGSDLSENDINLLEQILDQNDHDIYAWVMGTQICPSEFDGELINKIRQFSKSVHEFICPKDQA